MNFPSQIFSNNINQGFRAATLKKKFLWLVLFYMVVAIMKMCAERCALQLYQTSLRSIKIIRAMKIPKLKAIVHRRSTIKKMLTNYIAIE